MVRNIIIAYEKGYKMNLQGRMGGIEGRMGGIERQ